MGNAEDARRGAKPVQARAGINVHLAAVVSITTKKHTCVWRCVQLGFTQMKVKNSVLNVMKAVKNVLMIQLNVFSARMASAARWGQTVPLHASQACTSAKRAGNARGATRAARRVSGQAKRPVYNVPNISTCTSGDVSLLAARGFTLRRCQVCLLKSAPDVMTTVQPVKAPGTTASSVRKVSLFTSARA